ncbi:MAG: polysaccharide deacetylase family protein [Chloroflexota bacterium]|nr:polysaccharide deacetylase family protein [Chloroflexota bacterium]
MESTVTLIAYHRIAMPGNPDLADSLIDAYPNDFEEQLHYLAEHYTVVSAWDVVRALREGYSLPPHALVITFDDGYCCFRDTALPILQRLGLPVTLFIPTAFLGGAGTGFWWDAAYRTVMGTAESAIEVPGSGWLPLDSPAARRHAFNRLVARVERLPETAAAQLVARVVERGGLAPPARRYLLDWDDVAALAAGGVAIGPHTQHHPILAQLTPERVRAEVTGSWADLQAHIPHPLPIFCYPNGKPHAISPVAVAAVQAAGLAGACTMVAGLNVLGRTNPYLLYRVGMEAGESLQKYVLKLTAAARVYRNVKSLIRHAAH